jgi:hypothetical protein
MAKHTVSSVPTALGEFLAIVPDFTSGKGFYVVHFNRALRWTASHRYDTEAEAKAQMRIMRIWHKYIARACVLGGRRSHAGRQMLQKGREWCDKQKAKLRKSINEAS